MCAMKRDMSTYHFPIVCLLVTTVNDIGSCLYSLVNKHLHSIKRQAIVTINMHHKISGSIKQSCISRSPKSSVYFMSYYMHIITSQRITFHYLMEYFHASVLSAIVYENILYVFISLLKESDSTVLYIAFNAIYGNQNRNFHHINHSQTTGLLTTLY